MNCGNGFYYTIRQGDTLYLIAKKHGISVTDLLAANSNIDPKNLSIGQKICIPKKMECLDNQVYIVKRDDTFLLIAKRFDISYDSLQEANPDVDLGELEEGRRICIPESRPSKLCPNNRTYLIKKGDTLSSIAENFVVSATDILKLNSNMIPSEFIEGRLICLPPEVPV